MENFLLAHVMKSNCFVTNFFSMQKSVKPIGLHPGNSSNLWHGRVAITAIVLWIWLFSSSIASAVDNKKPAQVGNEKPVQDEFPPSPLDITQPDPLLPRPAVDRPLTAAERQNLALALDQLDAQAKAKQQAGDIQGAFEIWNRELQLRRLLGPLEEVEALGSVGAYAWSASKRTESQAITQRLQTIQQQAQLRSSTDPALLEAFGQAYQQVRTPEQALGVYNQILARARQRQDSAATEATLKTLAELYLSKFDYPNAATTYKELLDSARAKGDRDAVVTYMQQLAYIYEQSEQYQEAISTKQQLAQLYLNEKDLSQIPSLRLEIASDYEALDQVEKAFQNYQEAYSSAWSLQQYARASDALRRLISLYRSRNQLDETLETSKVLLETERLAGDDYGMMNTYDDIGQIYLKRNNYPESLAAFQKALEIAQQLNYQEAYFVTQINQVKQRLSK